MKFDPRHPLSTQGGRAKLVDVLLETSMGGSTRMTQTGPENLPRRYLPPGRYTDLFRLYTAECIAHRRPMASSTTFSGFFVRVAGDRSFDSGGLDRKSVV